MLAFPPKKTHPAFVTFLMVLLGVVVLLPSGTSGFATVKSNVKNQTRTTTTTTKASFLMAPLQMDESFGFGLSATTTTTTSSESSSSSSPPRGIVLNASIGLTVFLGGLMGFLTKQSKASLIAGSTFGGTLGFASALLANGSPKGNWVGGIVSSLLTYVMGKKFLKAYKFMPAGLVATMALSGIFYNGMEIMGRRTRTTNTDDSEKEEEQDDSPSSSSSSSSSTA